MTEIDPDSPVPAWRQVYSWLRRRIEEGAYERGRIPSKRDLSQGFGVAPNTVKKALDRLKAEGYLTVSHGVGLFVTDRAGWHPEPGPD